LAATWWSPSNDVTQGAQIIVAAVLFIGGFAALATSLTEGLSWALGRLGFAAALLEAAVLIVAIGIDGFTTKALADTFANSPASEKAWRGSQVIQSS
jgi:hypothetical protein